jgi:hypothetical protein
MFSAWVFTSSCDGATARTEASGCFGQDLTCRRRLQAGVTGRNSREPASIDNQTVSRMNCGTLYSSAVLDLGGPPSAASAISR